MGMVLTYKTTGVFNFAYGALAMFCAFTYWDLHDNWGLSAWVAMPVVFLVVAPVMGVVLEALFRPLSGVATEVLIVVSVGVLAALQALAPIAYGDYDRQLQPIFPISTFRLGSHLHVGYDQLGTLLVSLSMAALLWALLRRTRFGTSTRAVVDNPDLSDMIGVHGDQVRRTAWILSAVFASLVGILISPTQGLDFNQLVEVVPPRLVPAVLGILFGLPFAYIGGIALGIAVSVASKFSTNNLTITDLKAALPYIALFVLLVAFGNRLKDTATSARRMAVARGGVGSFGARLTMVELVGPSGGLEHLHWSGWAGAGPAGAVGGAGVGRLVYVTTGFIYALVALTLVVLTGWAGQISLAQFSFVGVGAFTAGHLAGSHGQHFLFAVLMGMLFAVPLGLIVGLVSLRLSGLYLALATLAFALMMDNIVFNSNSVSGGQTGITVARPHFFGLSFTGRAALYELCVVAFRGTGRRRLRLLRQAPIGRRLLILRDSPLAASTLGVNLTATKLTVFVVCGMVAALGGALDGALIGSITPLDFMWSASVSLLLLVVLGGRSVLNGAIIAGAVYALPQIPGIPVNIERVIPLAIAVGVIGLAQEPEGSFALAKRQTRHVLNVLRPLPRSGGYLWDRHGAAAWAPAVAAGVFFFFFFFFFSERWRPAMPGSAAVLSAQDVTVHFGGLSALSAVSLEVPAGQIVGLIGPNGAGKTTMFNVLTGLQSAVSGRVVYEGQDISGWAPHRRGRAGIARTFQRLALFTGMTVHDNLVASWESSHRGGVLGRGRAKRQQVVRAVMDLLALWPLADRLAGELSTGQGRMVELGRAMCTDAHLLLLDEPGSGLDANETAAFCRVLRTIMEAERPPAVLLVEHDMALVMEVCAELTVLDFGKVIAVGTPAEIRANELVRAAYLGDASVI